MDAEKFSEYFDGAPVFYGKGTHSIPCRNYIHVIQYLAVDTRWIFITPLNQKPTISMLP